MLRIIRCRVVQEVKRSNLFSVFGIGSNNDAPSCFCPTLESAIRTINVKQYASGPVDNHRLSNFDKRVLVWSGFYKNVQEVPETISTTKLLKARDWFRIRVSVYMIVGTVLGCAYMVWSGKQMLAEGKTIPKIAREKAAKLREDHITETAKKKPESETKA